MARLHPAPALTAPLTLKEAILEVKVEVPALTVEAFRRMAQVAAVPGVLPHRGAHGAYLIDRAAWAARDAYWYQKALQEVSKTRESLRVARRTSPLTSPGRSSRVRLVRKTEALEAARRFLTAPYLDQMRAVIHLLSLVEAGENEPVTITVQGRGEPFVYCASRREAWIEYDRSKGRDPGLDEMIFD